MRIALLAALIVAQAPLAFDVASIKPNNSGAIGEQVRFFPPSGRVQMTNVTVKRMIQNAYALQDQQIAGGPGWITSDHFDIVANSEATNLSPMDRWTMVRTLLADRFKLKMHTEPREQSVFGAGAGARRRQARRTAQEVRDGLHRADGATHRTDRPVRPQPVRRDHGRTRTHELPRRDDGDARGAALVARRTIGRRSHRPRPGASISTSSSRRSRLSADGADPASADRPADSRAVHLHRHSGTARPEAGLAEERRWM